MNELTTQWTYNMVETSEDKSRPRVSTRPGKAYEIIGADGNFDGGLMPISGFSKLAELDYQTTDSSVASAYQFGSASKVEDFFPVTFRIQKESGNLGTIPYPSGEYTLTITQTGNSYIRLIVAGGLTESWEL